ncbi:flagellar protein FlaG [Colwellia demingiae]|uniref:Flagellar protein FlaG n=1 Tax=Colwellia demingiae TaxID=89401 RepID=A0A5C6QM69_9GAMM|nr:flagellar protein FlaG [Colwellia demingiae]TWX69909.1 flagellar protein FlaG [Colwellia demingiae]
MSAINISTDNSHNVSSQRKTSSEKDLPVSNSSITLQSADEVQTDKRAAEAAIKVSDAEQKNKALMTSEQLEKVAQKLQDFVGEMNKGLEFSVDKDSGRDVIKVIDKNSGDLIKQYPTEEVLDLVAKLSEATGNFINTDA